MVMGFCNIRRSVACMLFMVVFSNVQCQTVRLSTTRPAPSPSVDTQRLESRLVNIEDQLNRVLSIVSQLSDPVISGNCTVEYASYGQNDSRNYGWVGGSGLSGPRARLVPWLTHQNPGVTLSRLDPITCIPRNIQNFDTYRTAADRRQMLEVLETASMGTIIIGITGYPVGNIERFAGEFFIRYNMDLAGLGWRDKFAFIAQKGYPKKTVFHRGPRDGEAIRIQLVLRGSTVSNASFHPLPGSVPKAPFG